MRFVLNWVSGRTQPVYGSNLESACMNAGIRRSDLVVLNSFERAGEVVKVAGQAPCGCVYHAEEEEACKHDLHLVGL